MSEEKIDVVILNGHEVRYPAWGRELFQSHRWFVGVGNPKRKNGEEKILYVKRAHPTIPGSVIFFHRELYPEIKCIHHLDKNGLNNTPSNISDYGKKKRYGSLMQNIQFDAKKNVYRVRYVSQSKNKKRITKVFSVSKYESKDAARVAAIKWRNHELKINK